MQVTEGKIRRDTTNEEKSLGNRMGMQREACLASRRKGDGKGAKRGRQNITEWGHWNHSISLHHTSIYLLLKRI